MLPLMRPGDEQELGKLLAEASATSTPLEIMGAGSKRSVGRPMQVAHNLSTRAMRGIALYQPTELVMSARAGTPLATVERELAKRGQILAFEPIDLGPITGAEAGQSTIGAVFASNLSGSRRIAVGAARDHLLGLRGVNGRGEVFKSGGRVMKNVTGYDLCKGLTGSWGTLAVFTEVTFKVMPAAETQRTLVFFGQPDEIATEIMCGALGTPYEVTGTLHLQPPLVERLWQIGLRQPARAVTLLRLEGFARSVLYRADRLRQLFKPYGQVEEIEHEASAALWDELRQLSFLQGSQNPVWRISTRPTSAHNVVAAISRYMECKAAYDWSGGLVWAEVLPTIDAGAADIRRVLATYGGHATLIRADAGVRAAVDVFQPLEAAILRIQRRIKESFDPAGILNPGRMYSVH